APAPRRAPGGSQAGRIRVLESPGGSTDFGVVAGSGKREAVDGRRTANSAVRPSPVARRPSPAVRRQPPVPQNGLHVPSPRRIAWPPVSLSSDQYAGFFPPTHSACCASAKPSLFRFGIFAGRSNSRVTTKRPGVG